MVRFILCVVFATVRNKIKNLLYVSKEYKYSKQHEWRFANKLPGKEICFCTWKEKNLLLKLIEVARLRTIIKRYLHWAFARCFDGMSKLKETKWAPGDEGRGWGKVCWAQVHHDTSLHGVRWESKTIPEEADKVGDWVFYGGSGSLFGNWTLTFSQPCLLPTTG